MNNPPSIRYPLDDIVNHRCYYNQRVYKVKWEDGTSSWVKEHILREDDCGNIIDAYHQRELAQDGDWQPDCGEMEKASEEEYRYKRRQRSTLKRRKLSKEIRALKAAESDWCFFPHSHFPQKTPEEGFDQDFGDFGDFGEKEKGQKEETSSEDSNIVHSDPVLNELLTFSYQVV
jgi:hypothetical protein